MPSNSKEYQAKVYKKYRWTTKAKKDRAKRNAARRIMEKAGKVKKWDKKDVDHVRGIKAGNGKSNLKVTSRSANRKKWALKAARVHNAKKRK